MSDIIEKDIEAEVITLLSEALQGVDGVRIEGSWQPDSSYVKGEERASDKVFIAVSTGAPSFESFAIPICEVPVSVAIVVRHELSPGGDALSTVMEAVSALLLDLQTCEAECVHTDLSVDRFHADGVRLDPGDPPQYDRDSHAWTVLRAFTVRGHLQSTTTT